MVMRGLKSFTSWRTLIVGMAMGYVIAWGVHWATTFYNWGIPVHDHIPGLTPEPPERKNHGG